ncbi:MAG TPA: class I SAM-dependent rRNA methyltransferase [Candidatus Angelobacter sp.]|nr:class I SAM-dependent rRNA methyltransferase [Candidatus Angelobacter sp.]
MANSSPQKVIVNDRAAKRLREGHAWVYASDVLNDAGTQSGALVHVIGPRDKALGSAIYSSSSQIKLRLLGREPLNSDDGLMELVRQRLAAAIDYRRALVSDSDACRLVFSEADRLPGLIVDRYNDVYTFQVLTQAWDRPERKQAIIEALKKLTGAENIVERTDERIRELEQLPAVESALASGSKSSTVFAMNSVRFHYDALGGQKTGAFLDQRENYAAALQYARGEALDVCTYQGGFALHLARTCHKVTAVDISREALEVAERNEKLNAAANKLEIEWIEGNAFDLMKDYATAGKQYDLIVLDPPAFAKSKKQLEAAMRGYKELNLRAMKMLRPGGVLVTCSCSFAVSEEDFMAMLTEAAQDSHRTVRVLEKRTQAKDHPILLGVPETFYLKCFVLSVA